MNKKKWIYLKNIIFPGFILFILIITGCEPDPGSQPEATPTLSPELTSGPTPEPIPDDTIHIPSTLLIYYGWPSAINSSFGNIELASAHFGNYDYVVLGSGLEEISHADHLNTIEIIIHPNTIQTHFFGYIDIGVTTNNYSMTEIQNKVDNWIYTGADGIFFDDYGYDFAVTRERQNTAVAYVHSKDSVVCANAWNPDHAFSSQVHSTYNPTGIATELNQIDYYLSESYQISEGNYQSELNWRNKADTLNNYQESLGFKIFSITTNDSSDMYDENKFFYSWYSTLLYNYEATGWGEYWFSANNSNAVYRNRPMISPGTYFMTDIIDSSPLFSRETDTGQLWINTQTHEAGFTPES